MKNDELIEEIEAQLSLMIAVATGGYERIKYENEEYKARRQRIREGLAERKLDDPNPHFDLWRWYGKWSSGDLPTYNSRRGYIGEMYDSTIDAIHQGRVQVGSDLFTEATGWARVDRTVDKIRGALETASSEEEFQAVGLFCRDCLISLAQAIYDSDIHGPSNGQSPSITDANSMIAGYSAHKLPGSSNEELRRNVKANLSFANALVHKRTAEFLDAAICAEATISTVNLIAIISGRRNPS